MIYCAEVGLSRAALWYVGQRYYEMSRDAARVLYLICLKCELAGKVGAAAGALAGAAPSG